MKVLCSATVDNWQPLSKLNLETNLTQIHLKIFVGPNELE